MKRKHNQNEQTFPRYRLAVKKKKKKAECENENDSDLRGGDPIPTCEAKNLGAGGRLEENQEKHRRDEETTKKKKKKQKREEAFPTKRLAVTKKK